MLPYKAQRLGDVLLQWAWDVAIRHDHRQHLTTFFKLILVLKEDL